MWSIESCDLHETLAMSYLPLSLQQGLSCHIYPNCVNNLVNVSVSGEPLVFKSDLYACFSSEKDQQIYCSSYHFEDLRGPKGTNT